MLVALYLRAFLGGVGKFLSSLSFWQIMFGAALILAGWQYIGKRAEQRHSQRVEAQLSKAIALSKVKQEQNKQIVERYIAVEKPVIRERVREIENAPLPGNCKTPEAILRADL
jgi:hypothetical protein